MTEQKINTITIPFEIIDLDEQKNILLIINALVGEHAVRMVVDTGASHSCLSKKVLKHIADKKEKKAEAVIGIGRGRLSNKLVHVPQFKVGDLEINDYPFLNLSLNHINKVMSMAGIEPIDGFLGSDILYAHQAQINYPTRTVQLQTDGNE